MKPSEIHEILDLAVRARKNGHIFNPLFVSPPGLGKTEIVGQWANEKYGKSIVMTLSSYDPPDFKGFPNIQLVKGKQRMTFATPDMWPDEGEGVIILEELNRSNTSIMQCILSLTDARRGFDGYKLPDGWIVVGCINPEDGVYDTVNMDPALKDRFEMFQVTYDKKSHLDYMEKTGYDPSLRNFVESGIYQYKTPEEIGNVAGSKYSSPRTLSKVNTILKAGFKPDMELMLFTTELGANVAKDFYNFRHNESPVMMNDLDKNLKASLKKLEKFSTPENYKNGMISLTVKDIIETNTISDDVLAQVVLSIPVEQGTVLIRELEVKRNDVSMLARLCSDHKEVKALFKSVLKYGTTNGK